jgi:hypothetical protein
MSMVNKCVELYPEVLSGVPPVPNHLNEVLWHLSDETIYCLERHIVPHVPDDVRQFVDCIRLFSMLERQHLRHGRGSS